MKTIKLKGSNFPVAIITDNLTNNMYVANEHSDTLSVFDKFNYTIMRSIAVGGHPVALALALDIGSPGIGSNVYVANAYSNTVSVVNPTTYTGIANIPVGKGPSSLAINPNSDKMYVANSGSNTVSVIDPYNISKSTEGSVVTNIEVGKRPSGIAIDSTANKIYVANAYSNTVSVIDGNNDNVSKTISVGKFPREVAFDINNNNVYVANAYSNTVSVIDSKTDQVVLGSAFAIHPSDAGKIKCDDIEIRTSKFIRIKYSSQCKAEANTGFIFSSWAEDLGTNSTKTITNMPDSKSIISYITNLIYPNDTTSTFKLSRSGSFIANFRDAPSPIPKEIWLSLFAIMLGTFMPSVVKWLNGWRQRKNMNKCMKEIDINYSKLNEIGRRKETMKLYTKGNLHEFLLFLRPKLGSKGNH